MVKRKLVSKPTYLIKLQSGGSIPKFQNSGKLPIGTKSQYDHVVELYQSFVDKGIDPQVALDLVNQKVAEKGWTGYSTGDNKKYPDANSFTDHVIDWHQRMYPDSLKSKDFEQFYRGIMVTPKYKYNPRGNAYKLELEKTRPGVKRRINYYREQQGLPPLSYVLPTQDSEQLMYAKNGGSIQKMQLGDVIQKGWSYLFNGHDGTFNEAYKTARNNGEKYFRWNGNLYNTEYKFTPASTPDPTADYNSLRYEYIKALENPNMVGYDAANDRWTSPTQKGFDPNQIGIGLDKVKNKDVKQFLAKNKRDWLSDSEMRQLQNKSFQYFEEVLGRNTKGLNLSNTKRAAAVGLLYHGHGPKLWDRKNPLSRALFQGSDWDFINAITKFYTGRNTVRANAHSQFFNKISGK